MGVPTGQRFSCRKVLLGGERGACWVLGGFVAEQEWRQRTVQLSAQLWSSPGAWGDMWNVADGNLVGAGDSKRRGLAAVSLQEGYAGIRPVERKCLQCRDACLSSHRRASPCVCVLFMHVAFLGLSCWLQPGPWSRGVIQIHFLFDGSGHTGAALTGDLWNVGQKQITASCLPQGLVSQLRSVLFLCGRVKSGMTAHFCSGDFLFWAKGRLECREEVPHLHSFVSPTSFFQFYRSHRPMTGPDGSVGVSGRSGLRSRSRRVLLDSLQPPPWSETWKRGRLKRQNILSSSLLWEFLKPHMEPSRHLHHFVLGVQNQKKAWNAFERDGPAPGLRKLRQENTWFGVGVAHSSWKCASHPIISCYENKSCIHERGQSLCH